MKEWLKKRIGEISVKLFSVALLFGLSVFLFAFLVHIAVWQNEDLFDTTVFNFFKSFSTPGFVDAMKTITHFGSSYFLLPAYIILATWLLLKRRVSDAIDIGVIGITSTGLKVILKNVFQRNRPELPLFETLHTYSFPSGHALSSFIFCSLLIFLISKSHLQKSWKWILSVLLILFSIIIGVSRIVLRYHYPSDVLAGFCLGFAWVLFSLWFQKRISKKLRERNNKNVVFEAENSIKTLLPATPFFSLTFLL